MTVEDQQGEVGSTVLIYYKYIDSGLYDGQRAGVYAGCRRRGPHHTNRAWQVDLHMTHFNDRREDNIEMLDSSSVRTIPC